MTKRRERLTVVSHSDAMVVAMDRAIEWSSTLEPTDEQDAEWERQFRIRCKRYLERLGVPADAGSSATGRDI